MEVENYDQAHYIEKQGLHIIYVLENDNEDFVEEEAEDNCRDPTLRDPNSLLIS